MPVFKFVAQALSKEKVTVRKKVAIGSLTLVVNKLKIYVKGLESRGFIPPSTFKKDC